MSKKKINHVKLGQGLLRSTVTVPAASTMDTSVDDSSKRAASAGESDERDPKEQKPGDESEHTEVSHVERMMQEDLVWSVTDVSDMCEETSGYVRRAATDMNFFNETTGELFNQPLLREAEDEGLQRFKKMVCMTTWTGTPRIRTVRASLSKSDGYVVNKGTLTNPHMKCRHVAQERGYGTRMDELYANTSGLSLHQVSNVVSCAERKGAVN